MNVASNGGKWMAVTGYKGPAGLAEESPNDPGIGGGVG